MEKGMTSFQIFKLYLSTYSSILIKYFSSTFIFKIYKFLSIFTIFIARLILLPTVHYHHTRFHIHTIIRHTYSSWFFSCSQYSPYSSPYSPYLSPDSPSVHYHHIHFQILSLARHAYFKWSLYSPYSSPYS